MDMLIWTVMDKDNYAHLGTYEHGWTCSSGQLWTGLDKPIWTIMDKVGHTEPSERHKGHWDDES
eukprot:scaffold520028_cov33-Prasinocladus_malaysianus.AAC.1